jgi:hypothetical protein
MRTIKEVIIWPNEFASFEDAKEQIGGVDTRRL